MEQAPWSENVILIDADGLDNTASNIIQYFERELNRSLPAVDLCHWLNCITLDIGLEPGNNNVQVLFIHSSQRKALKCFTPGHFTDELDGRAFKDKLGEFTLHSFPVEKIVSTEDFFLQSLETLGNSADIKRLIVVPNMEAYGMDVCSVLSKIESKELFLFSMESQVAGSFTHEVLGFSLINALGIRSEELG